MYGKANTPSPIVAATTIAAITKLFVLLMRRY
jgi:hypothetical protein